MNSSGAAAFCALALLHLVSLLEKPSPPSTATSSTTASSLRLLLLPQPPPPEAEVSNSHTHGKVAPSPTDDKDSANMSFAAFLVPTSLAQSSFDPEPAASNSSGNDAGSYSTNYVEFEFEKMPPLKAEAAGEDGSRPLGTVAVGVLQRFSRLEVGKQPPVLLACIHNCGHIAVSGVVAAPSGEASRTFGAGDSVGVGLVGSGQIYLTRNGRKIFEVESDLFSHREVCACVVARGRCGGDGLVFQVVPPSRQRFSPSLIVPDQLSGGATDEESDHAGSKPVVLSEMALEALSADRWRDFRRPDCTTAGGCGYAGED